MVAQVFPPGHYMFGSSLTKQSPAPEPIRFYTEQWITDVDYLPTNPVDLKTLRIKFEESVRRHLLAEVQAHICIEFCNNSRHDFFSRFPTACCSLGASTPP